MRYLGLQDCRRWTGDHWHTCVPMVAANLDSSSAQSLQEKSMPLKAGFGQREYRDSTWKFRIIVNDANLSAFAPRRQS